MVFVVPEDDETRLIKAIILPAACRLIMGTLHNGLRIGKSVVIARMVGVEMSANEKINVARRKSQHCKLIHNIIHASIRSVGLVLSRR